MVNDHLNRLAMKAGEKSELNGLPECADCFFGVAILGFEVDDEH